MSLQRRAQRRLTIKHGGAKVRCAAGCDKVPEVAVGNDHGKIILLCRACAKRIAKELKLPNLTSQLQQSEPS